MNGSPKIAIRSDAQNVKVAGGESGILDWIESQMRRVKLEQAQLEKKLDELKWEEKRLKEIAEILTVVEQGKTALIVAKN
jgi:hypothetical protein